MQAHLEWPGQDRGRARLHGHAAESARVSAWRPCCVTRHAVSLLVAALASASGWPPWMVWQDDERRYKINKKVEEERDEFIQVSHMPEQRAESRTRRQQTPPSSRPKYRRVKAASWARKRGKKKDDTGYDSLVMVQCSKVQYSGVQWCMATGHGMAREPCSPGR